MTRHGLPRGPNDYLITDQAAMAYEVLPLAIAFAVNSKTLLIVFAPVTKGDIFNNLVFQDASCIDFREYLSHPFVQVGLSKDIIEVILF